MKATWLITSLLILPTANALATDSPWAGTWKLDEARSHFTGGTMTFSSTTGDGMHFSDGSTTSYDFAADGKEYRAWANRVVVWTAPEKNVWQTLVKADGKLLATGHREL